MSTDPVNVHRLARNAFYGHLDAFLPKVLFEKIAVQFVKLGQLVSIRMFRLVVIQPDECQIRMLHLRHHFMNDEKIRNSLISVATVFFRVELEFNILRIHDPELFKRESQFPEPCHDKGNDTAADLISA